MELMINLMTTNQMISQMLIFEAYFQSVRNYMSAGTMGPELRTMGPELRTMGPELRTVDPEMRTNYLEMNMTILETPVRNRIDAS